MRRLICFIGILCLPLFSGCGGGGGGDINEPANRPERSISIVPGAETRGTGAFAPNPLMVPANSEVHWFNDDRAATRGEYGGSDGTIHSIVADDLAFQSGNLAPGSTFEHGFATPGTYNFHCGIHPAMKGTVTVTP